MSAHHDSADARNGPRGIEVALDLVGVVANRALGQQVEEGVQIGDALHGHVRDLEDGHNRLRVQRLRASHHIRRSFDLDRMPAHPWPLQQRGDLM